MAAILTGIGLAVLDTAIANTALPTIAADLGVDPGTSVWIVNAYQLAVVATLLPMAALGEIVGQQRVFVAGIALFTASSLVCALAWSLPTLVAARVLQGLGASAIMAVNIALVRFVYPLNSLGRGVGLNALTGSVCFVAGPTVASLILFASSWPWLFAVNVPIGLAALALALTSLPETGRAKHRFDGIGALLNVITFSLLILGLGEAAHDQPPWRIALELAGTLVVGTLLLRRQANHPAPMLAVDLLKRPLFTLSAVTAICSFAAQGLAFVSLPFLFQHQLGRSQVETGFLMTPWPVVVALMAPVAGRLSDRHSPGLLGGIGLAVLAVGMGLLATLPEAPSVADIAWRMMICGAGFGFFQAPNLRALMTSAPPERAGGASGIVATSRLLGQTLGAALVAACFAVSEAHGPALAMGLGGIFAGAASIASFTRLAVRPG
ncbi:DHA2 family multidrug resistance protein-like MFS transporter [Methylobacterium brachythecii]|uniref:MFS transporter n=2 Tax=Methylobacterium brachythecii TaxID=1176177 RepID=A0A7W6AKX2_9HYPH|nr:DHA2 family multidrug resistance protein-like MFS transporter [Methylobacterium brachythecii]GLS45824.1 MFS transporter [Methylobacterium brachythecii]